MNTLEGHQACRSRRHVVPDRGVTALVTEKPQSSRFPSRKADMTDTQRRVCCRRGVFAGVLRKLFSGLPHSRFADVLWLQRAAALENYALAPLQQLAAFTCGMQEKIDNFRLIVNDQVATVCQRREKQDGGDNMAADSRSQVQLVRNTWPVLRERVFCFGEKCIFVVRFAA